MRLESTTALITGGGSGIGRAIACKFAQEGSFVIVADMNRETGTSVAAEIKGAGGEAEFAEVDTANAASVKALFDLVDGIGRGLNIVVNNAGQGGTLTPIHLLEDEQWDAMLATHLNGTFYCTREAIRRMLVQKSGAIINLGSVAGLRGFPGAASYAAAKGGIISFTRAVAQEVAAAGIRVNCIAPGWVETPILDSLPGKLRDGMAASTPLGRIGAPDEVANLALFLASEESSYVIGQTISPNGGTYF